MSAIADQGASLAKQAFHAAKCGAPHAAARRVITPSLLTVSITAKYGWLGHSERVKKNHYFQLSDADFLEATQTNN